MSTNLRRSPRLVNRAITVPIVNIDINTKNTILTKNTIIATFREKLVDIESTKCCDCKLKRITALFKFILQKECIAFVKSNRKLHTVILNKAKDLRDHIKYANHTGSLENKVALINTSKRLEKALL